MRRLIRNTVYGVAKAAGFDLLRLSQSPRRTFLAIDRRPIKSIIDVGANRGQFAQEMRHRLPDAVIHSFEPLPGPYNALKSWAETQDGKVFAYNMALGAENGELQMNNHIEHSASSSLLKSTERSRQLYPQMTLSEQVTVQVRRLDDHFGPQTCQLEPQILLKLDVQGYEEVVLAGGRQLLGVCDVVIAELGLEQLYDGQAEFYSLCKFMQDAGLRYCGNLEQQHADDGHAIYVDLVFARDV